MQSAWWDCSGTTSTTAKEPATTTTTTTTMSVAGPTSAPLMATTPPPTATTTTSTTTTGSPPRGQSLLECDYDANPTYLYQAVEAKQWDHVRAVFSGANAQRESATWVVRKETNGKLRWRLLPVHAAIIFKAPLDILELMLQEYPTGAQCKDDQGMLPLHLAFRNDSDWEVLEELLTAYPQAVVTKDRKGRTPLQCASQNTAKRASVMELFTQIAVSAERQRAVQESRTVLEARVAALQDTHVKTLTNLKNEWEQQLKILKEDLDQSKERLADTLGQLEDSNAMLQHKTASELELTQKLSQVAAALNAVNEARAMEESLEKQRAIQRERVLKDANEELLKMVHQLMDQQTSLKVQLDKQAWESKERKDEREKKMEELMRIVARDEEVEDQNMWRSQLQDCNQEVASRVNTVLEKVKVVEEQQKHRNAAIEKAKAEAMAKTREAQELASVADSSVTAEEEKKDSSSVHEQPCYTPRAAELLLSDPRVQKAKEDAMRMAKSPRAMSKTKTASDPPTKKEVVAAEQ